MSKHCVQRTEEALQAIAAAGDEGDRIFVKVYTASARAEAAAADARAAAGVSLGPIDGRIVSIKDLFDVAGEPTTAGSKVLRASASIRTTAPLAMPRMQAASPEAHLLVRV